MQVAHGVQLVHVLATGVMHRIPIMSLCYCRVAFCKYVMVLSFPLDLYKKIHMQYYSTNYIASSTQSYREIVNHEQLPYSMAIHHYI